MARCALCVGLLAVILGVLRFSVAEERADDEPPLPPDAARWSYPKARALGVGGGGHLTQAVLTTPDDFNTVIAWYKEQTGVSVAAKESARGVYSSRADIDGPNVTSFIAADDSHQPFEEVSNSYPRRSVRIRVATHDTPKFFASAVISRASGEQHTHIVVTYLRK